MTIESTIYTALKSLVSGNVYDTQPPDTLTATTYIVYQQVGGDSINFLSSEVPSKRNGRFQINTWAPTAHQAAALARQAESAMRGINAYVFGDAVSTDDPDVGLFGRRQDFSLWSDY